MKRNILTIIIIAALLVNLTLTAMMLFVMVPYQQKADKLITNILQVLQLDLESPLPSDYASQYELDDLEAYTVFTDQNTNLKTGTDGKARYAVVDATIYINSAHADYKTKNPLVEKNKAVIESIIIEEINKYTADEIIEKKSEIEAAALEKIQSYFGSKFVVIATLKILVA